jgi:hypothetical protein
MLTNELFVLLHSFLGLQTAARRTLAVSRVSADYQRFQWSLGWTELYLLRSIDCECAGFRRGIADYPHGLFTRSSDRHAVTYMRRPNTMPAGGAVDR